MGFSDNIASSLNNFNNLINNQIAQNNFNNNLVNQNKGANSTNFSNNQTIDISLKTALTGLASLLSTNNTSSVNPVNQNSYIVNKLIQGGADANKVNGLLSLLSASTDDIAYTRTGANDPNITLQNRNQVFGQDIQPFLSQASEIVRRGEDINKYLDTATNIVNKGDYDDFRRFISVTNTAIYATNNDSQELNKFFDFSQGVLDKRHYDLESNIFDVQTMIRYGATLDTSIKIMSQMEHIGLEGRNNMVDLNRVTIDAKNKGLYLPFLFQKMSESGDTRAFLNDYMAHNNMQTTAPDFNKFKRIERIDGEDMVIKQGESAALFAQAVSSVDGLLPQSSLYWSSLQSGAVSNGSSYLDLSKLAPGTYDMYVKVGPGYGGTDTAKKRVIVLPKDEPSDPVVFSSDGKLKITVEKGSAGLASDLYFKVNGKDTQLVTTEAQTNTGFTLEKDFKDGDQLDFFIKTHGDSWGLGTYDHGTDTAAAPSGKAYYQKEQLSDNSWRIKFEDLPEGRSDFDYNDVVIKVELVKNPPKLATVISPPIPTFGSEIAPDKTAINNLVALIGNSALSPSQEDDEYFPEMEKLKELYNTLKNNVSAHDTCKLLDDKVGKDKVVGFLNSNGQESLGKKYKKGEVEISDVTNAYADDAEIYEKSISEFRKFVEKEDVKKFFDSKKVSEGDSDKALKLLGFDNSDVKDDKKQLNLDNNIQVNLDVQNLEKK